MGFSFFLLMLVRTITSLFFRFDIRWLSQQGFEVGKEVRLIVLLNHTSLFEPVFIRVAPVGMIWRPRRSVSICATARWSTGNP